MARRRRSTEANIWPGFVDGLSTLLLVLMFVLSIFVVAQFYLGSKLNIVKDELAERDSELARLTARINALAEQLGLAQAEKDKLAQQVLSLESTIDEKNKQVADLTASLAASQAAVAASAEELKAEKALTEDQKSQLATLNAQLAALRKQLASLQQALDAAEAKDKEQQAQIENLSQRLNAALARKVQELQEVRSRFFEALRAALGDRKDIKVVGDRFVFESDILFGSCSATIGEAGKVELTKLASILNDIKGQIPSEIPWVLRVDGIAARALLRGDIQVEPLIVQRNMRCGGWSFEDAGVPAKRTVATGSGSEWRLRRRIFRVSARAEPAHRVQTRRALASGVKLSARRGPRGVGYETFGFSLDRSIGGDGRLWRSRTTVAISDEQTTKVSQAIGEKLRPHRSKNAPRRTSLETLRRSASKRARLSPVRSTGSA
ncbi:MAG: hypothetical protein R3C60_13085 [Parvularculaceae bacterium]